MTTDNKIKNILISQPAPANLENSQYKNIIEKYDVNLTFNKFFDVVSISNKEFRAERINILDYSAVIMTSTLAVDNYFHFAGVERLKIPDDMKFFCITETVANYLQNYIQYRKRKIFPGKITFDDLTEIILKHSDEKFLFPCAEDARPENFKKLETLGIDYTKVVMYRSEPKDVRKEIDIKKFDMVVLFSPIGVKSFIMNFPKTTSDNVVFGAFGPSTLAALKKAKIKVAIQAPTAKAPSMVMALDNYLAANMEAGTEKKSSTTKKTTTSKTATTIKEEKPKKTSTTKTATTKSKTTATTAEKKTVAKKTATAKKATTTTKKTTTAKTKKTTKE
ncbi:MAG: uroporphyrinogen-III synthase [Bacteroidales bacterium]|nr:uroporphyrinogen-III synthase [Candidatus Scybalousia scybalohippi]